MDIKMIKTEKEYELALAKIEQLMDAEPGSPEEEKLEVLSLLVEKYEEENYPIDMPDPVSAIKFRMEQQELRQKDLVPFIGSQPQVSAVLNGKRELSKDMIRRLHKGLGIPYEVLLQSPNEEYEAQKYDVADFPFDEMVHFGYFPGYSAVRKAKSIGERLLDRLFSVFTGELSTPVYCRHSQKQINENALLAWQAHVLNLVSSESLPKYQSKALNDDFLSELLHFSAYEAGVVLVEEHLNKIGIHFKIAKHLQKTFLDGASFLTPDGAPVIGITLRYDRLDNFWFTLFHELAHVKLHLSEDPDRAFFDETYKDNREICEPHEQEANQFAWNILIPDRVWHEIFDQSLGLLSRNDILFYAEKLRINPAIIAGRIRYQLEDYSLYSDLIGNNKVRKQFHEFLVSV
ncbi:MAG: ImmA/IrrE family metallo-endopeptidase [Candidatus Helarchaeota archaeon]